MMWTQLKKLKVMGNAKINLDWNSENEMRAYNSAEDIVWESVKADQTSSSWVN